MTSGMRNYGALREHEEVISYIDKIIDSDEPFAFDIEAGYVGADKPNVALQQFHPDYLVVGISFTNSTSWARYIPFAHDSGGNVDNIVVVARALWRMLQTGRGVAHNCAYELKGMSRWFRETLWNDSEVGSEVREKKGMFPYLADTMLTVWLAADYHPKLVGKDLKSVAKIAFGLQMTKFADLFPTEPNDMGPTMKRGKIRFARFNTRNSYHPTIINYACEDSVAALLVYQKYIKLLQKSPIYRIETALISVLVEMEAGPIDENGVATGNMLFDWPVIRRKSAEVVKFAELMGEEILSTLSERLGRVININLGSPKQLAEVLFSEKPEGLGLPIKNRSEKTGDPSTADKALRDIAKSDPIIKRILQYRQVIKLNSAYLAKFIEELGYSGTGYVFPNHNQFGALTGRMSVDQVSYQQWPKPYHFQLNSGLSFDLNFRDLFISPNEFRLIGFDYANVEMRIAGALSGERKIIDAFNSGKDLHRATAAATFKVPYDQVTKKQRQAAKTLNFAILYGSGANNIADMLTTPNDPVTKEDAEQMLADYLEGYPTLAQWINDQKAHGREQKWVSTKFGRLFTVWEYYDPYPWMRAKGDRMTVNAPVQGTAADIIKLAMVNTQKAIHAAGLSDKIRMTLTVHDALEFLVHDSVSTQEVIDLIDPCVNLIIPGFDVEIRADWHEGYQWGAVADIELDDKKQITGYSMTYELPWTGEAFEWKGSTVREALDPYYQWESGRFGVAVNYYSKRHPDFQQAAWVEDEPSDVLTGTEEERGLPVTAVVTVTDMPTDVQWTHFETFLSDRPGEDTVVLETPEGKLTLDGGYKLITGDQPTISLILGGATLNFVFDELDPDALIEGLIL